MKLTGKAKEEFEKWYLESPQGKWFNLYTFGELTEAMQWGVYVDFADSVGIDLWIRKISNHSVEPFYFVHDNPTDYKTRPEARTAAIEKFNEIFNNTN